MIPYCYIGDYNDQKHVENEIADDEKYVSRINTNAEMYALAEVYDMQGLGEAAKSELDDLLPQPTYYAPLVGGVIPGDTLKPAINHVADVIPLVYNPTPESDRGLRGSLLDFEATIGG